MPNTRRSYPPTLKAKVAIEAIRGQKTIAELGQLYSVSPALVTNWKRQALDGLVTVFAQPHSRDGAAGETEKEQLYQQIGQLKVELDWLKKRSGLVG